MTGSPSNGAVPGGAMPSGAATPWRATPWRAAGPGGDVRVGDRERSAAADRLAAHAAAGRLTVEELEQRVERAHAAVLRRDLDTLLADLPEPRRAPRVPPAGAPLALAAAVAAALAATVALSLVVGHPLPPLFLLLLLVWRRFA
jgi:Domain of unknown function (DUF1707)